MWRSEAGLGHWLRHPRSADAIREGGLLDRMRSIMMPRTRACRLITISTAVPESDLKAVHLIMSQMFQVFDGLALLPLARPDGAAMCAPHRAPGSGEVRVCSLAIPNDSAVRAIPLAGLDPPAVRSVRPSIAGGVRDLVLPVSQARTRSGVLLKAHVRRPVQSGARWLYRRRLRVQTGWHRVSRAPLRRRSCDISSLPERERLDFLIEAARLKGVAIEQAELLGVFRKIPIELVSRMRFQADGKVLFYTLVSAGGLHRTRVHDMAAVADRVSGQIHMVVHRSRYHTAFLG